MKNTIAIGLICLVLSGFSSTATVWSQTPAKTENVKTEKLKKEKKAKKGKKEKAAMKSYVIASNPQCDMCVAKIEGAIGAMKGIRLVRVDLAQSNVIVKYAPDKISLDEIKQKIAGLGYDADEVKANPEAYKALPDCCKKE